MPGFGGYAPGAERYGGAKPVLKAILDSLNQQRGTAYNTDVSSSVWVENMAFARAILAVWDQNGRLGFQNDPFRMTVTLPRWEKILACPPLPGDSDNVRRARVQAKFRRIGQRVSSQYVSDQIAAALGAIFVKVIHLDLTDCLSWWPDHPNVLASTTIAAGSNGLTLPLSTISVVDSGPFGSPPTQPAGLAYITSSLGAQMIAYSGVPLPNEVVFPNKLYGCSGGVGVLATGGAVVKTATPWYSTLAHLVIKTQVPTGWTEAEYQAALAKGHPLLDAILPSWTTWTFYRNGGGHVGGPWVKDPSAGFFLDEPNLDREVFDR